MIAKIKHLMPLILVAAAAILFSFNDLVFKHLTKLNISWWDFLVFGVPVEIIFIILFAGYINNFNKKRWMQELTPKRYFFPVLRGGLAIIAIAFIFLSLKNLPLSTTTMLVQTTPIWMAVVACFFKDEKPDKFVIFSILLGFLGVIFIVKPSAGLFSFFLLAPLLVAIINSIMNFIVTKFTDDASPLSYALLLFITNGLMGLIIWIYMGIDLPNIQQLLWIFLGGFLGASAFICLTYGLSIAKGNFARTGVMSYIQIPCAILLGSIFYGESPKLTAYFGTILIFIAGIVVIYKSKIKK